MNETDPNDFGDYEANTFQCITPAQRANRDRRDAERAAARAPRPAPAPEQPQAQGKKNKRR